MTDEFDINKPIVKEQSIVQGCETGIHDWDTSSIKLEPAGQFTRITAACLRCGQIMIRDEPLNVNNIIIETVPKTGEERAVEQKKELDTAGFGPKPPWADTVEDKYKKDRSEDAFWDTIKKNRR